SLPRVSRILSEKPIGRSCGVEARGYQLSRARGSLVPGWSACAGGRGLLRCSLVARRLSNSIGIDDAPFDRSHRGDVAIVGVVFTRTRLDGVMTGKLRRDGANATQAIADLIEGSPFAEHAQVLLLGGITFGGFNVVDIHALRERLELPVLVLARRRPRYA